MQIIIVRYIYKSEKKNPLCQWINKLIGEGSSLWSMPRRWTKSSDIISISWKFIVAASNYNHSIPQICSKLALHNKVIHFIIGSTKFLHKISSTQKSPITWAVFFSIKKKEDHCQVKIILLSSSSPKQFFQYTTQQKEKQAYLYCILAGEQDKPWEARRWSWISVRSHTIKNFFPGCWRGCGLVWYGTRTTGL